MKTTIQETTNQILKDCNIAYVKGLKLTVFSHWVDMLDIYEREDSFCLGWDLDFIRSNIDEIYYHLFAHKARHVTIEEYKNFKTDKDTSDREMLFNCHKELQWMGANRIDHGFMAELEDNLGIKVGQEVS